MKFDEIKDAEQRLKTSKDKFRKQTGLTFAQFKKMMDAYQEVVDADEWLERIKFYKR